MTRRVNRSRARRDRRYEEAVLRQIDAWTRWLAGRQIRRPAPVTQFLRAGDKAEEYLPGPDAAQWTPEATS